MLVTFRFYNLEYRRVEYPPYRPSSIRCVTPRDRAIHITASTLSGRMSLNRQPIPPYAYPLSVSQSRHSRHSRHTRHEQFLQLICSLQKGSAQQSTSIDGSRWMGSLVDFFQPSREVLLRCQKPRPGMHRWMPCGFRVLSMEPRKCKRQ